MDLTSYTNFKITASGTLALAFTRDSGSIGNAGNIVIYNSAAITPGALLSYVYTPNGDNVVWVTTSGAVSIISYYVYSVDIIMINYVGDFQST